jgi:8-oxo-dGTP diphosphatase
VRGLEERLIRAAGGLLWRPTPQGYEIAVIHRRKYADWTLPKGKLHPGESWAEAALREVGEETGYAAALLGFAGAIAYTTDKGPKVVRFWHMLAGEKTNPPSEDEVDEVAWLPVEAARERLQYPVEQALLDAWGSPGDEDRWD